MSVVTSNSFRLNLLTLSIASSLFLASANALAVDCGNVSSLTGATSCTGTSSSPDAILVIDGANINHTAASNVINVAASKTNGGNANLTIINSSVSSSGGGHYGVSVDGVQSELTLSGNNTVNVGSNMDTAILLTSTNGAKITIDGVLNVTNSSTSNPNERDAVETNVSDSGNSEIYHNGTGTIRTVNGNGLFAKNAGAGGDAIIHALGGASLNLITTGNNANGIASIINNANSAGHATVNSNATIQTSGASGYGIYAQSTNGDSEVTNSGTITTTGAASSGIYTRSVGTGNTSVDNSGVISVSGKEAYGISAGAASGNVTVINSGLITALDARGVLARSATGNVLVYATNNITTEQATATVHNHGIDAAVSGGPGNVDVYYDQGTIKVTGITSGGGNTIGIASWDSGSGLAGVNASINLGSTAIIDATEGVGGLQIRSNGTGVINIDRGAEVHGGTDYGVNIYSVANGTIGAYEINNDGWVDSMNDLAVKVSTEAGSTLIINNAGTMDGYLNLGAEDSVFNNLSSDSWNIRNFTDTDGDQIRDTKGVAISNFGAGNDVFKNEATGTVRLSAVSGVLPTNATGQYSANGALSIMNEGTVQGQLLNLNRFENRGIIDLSENQQAGDLLVITGNFTAAGSSVHSGGTIISGGGQFVTDGGFLILDTVLNDGGVNALSDILVVDDVVSGTEATRIIINRVDGFGSVTSGDGIQVVEVLGNADAGSFQLANVVKAGAYEYTLHQGALSNPANNSLFLRTNRQQVTPDVGAYLANQTAATGLFMHSLHDRLGEPQFYQNYQGENKKIPAVWLRGSIAHSENEAVDGALKQKTDSNVIHLGGEVADWTINGSDRYHLGLMGAYGRSETKTTNKVTGTRADSTVDGYGVGAYLTWYSNEFAPEGWYADAWTMYGWFDNETDSAENYDSKAWTTSIELGYAAKLRALENYDWMIEPQAQLAYHHYSVSDIKDRGNTLTVNNSDAKGISSRLGMRTYLRPSTGRSSFQPFFEANWLYNSAENSMDFNGETFASDMPENRFETKLGVQGELTTNLQVYTHIGYQFGQDSYSRTEGQIGLRYRF